MYLIRRVFTNFLNDEIQMKKERFDSAMTFNGMHLDPNNVENLIIKFTNCRILRGESLISNDILLVRDGKILDPEYVFFVEKKVPDLEIDCDNLIIAPGFIDAQLNGAFGKDFTCDTENFKATLEEVSYKLLKYGCTSYCPTIVSSQRHTYEELIPQIKRTDARTSENIGANILGIHLEGPFISSEKIGAHELSTLRKFDNGVKSLQDVYGSLDALKANCSIITLAPEFENAMEVIEYLTKNNIVVSIGHTMATLNEGEKAVRHGARFITHLFNAMCSFHHRDPHLVGLLSNEDFVNEQKLYYGIISDLVHTHPSAVNIAYKTHPEGMVLVTDAMSAMGLEGGNHHLGNKSVEIRHENENSTVRSAYILGTNVLCGAVATINECVQNLTKSTGCSIEHAIRCASEHPAKMLGIFPRKGSLNFGADADFIIIDDQVNVHATFINGDIVWSRKNWTPLFKFKTIV